VHDIISSQAAQAATLEGRSPSSPAAPQPGVERFQFTGKAREYFGIWIVNLFLTIVTLGIYSAWAKVRKKRYFYGNTWVAGANFDYHGNPVAILKGRILAFGAFAAYTLAGQYSPRTAAMVALVFMPAIPWLVTRSFAFNAVNTSYRNLRFHFHATYRDGLAAVWPIVIFPVLALVMPQIDPQKPQEVSAAMMWGVFLPPLAFALFYPYIVARVNRLHIDHARYGTAPFAMSAKTGEFYVVYVIAMALIVAIAVVMGLLGASMFFAPKYLAPLVPVVLFAVYILGFSAIFGFTRAKVGNLVLGSTRLGSQVRFPSALKVRPLARIYVTNALAIVFSLGLAIPWAAIRVARYRAECLALECEGGLESFAAAVAATVTATGEEMGDMFAVDLSL
jgi:uncharacterized membrane protein YjgN (DUF898 family)